VKKILVPQRYVFFQQTTAKVSSDDAYDVFSSISFFVKRNKTPLPVFYFIFAAALCNWLQQSSRSCWVVLYLSLSLNLPAATAKAK